MTDKQYWGLPCINHPETGPAVRRKCDNKCTKCANTKRNRRRKRQPEKERARQRAKDKRQRAAKKV